MKIATWNVNSLRARLARVEELLAQHQPDVVLLQETKTSEEQFPHDELAAMGYGAVDRSSGRWTGVAILARDGLAILVVEQNLAMATAMAERQLVMVAGRIFAETTAAELAADPDLQRRFLGVERG